MAVRGSTLSSVLDQKPPLSEVCEYARTSHWYKLGIQLEVDEVELKEIRDITGSDKRTLMYQLWLRTQPNATRRQLLTALRTKDVGEEVVASKYEHMLFGMLHASQLTSGLFTEQTFENAPNPVVDILYHKIEHVPELASIAVKLKREFRLLLVTVQDSVKECHLLKVISLIRLAIVENLRNISKSIQLYKRQLSSIQTVDEVFAFLIDNHFVGYLNYGLLKEISELVKDAQVKEQFVHYESEYKHLVSASTFNILMQVFHNYPDLSPTTAVGLPEVMFRLDNPWPEKSMSTWEEHINARFPNWAGSLAPKEFSSECIIVTYAILPSALPAVLKDLRDPTILKELEDIGVTIIQLSNEDNNDILSRDDDKGEASNKSIVTLETEPSTSLDNKTPLHYAIEKGDLSIIHTLLDKGANIDCVDKDNKTPLHYAIERGDLSIVQVLINKGACLDCIDKDNKTPLHYAVERGEQSIVYALIDKEASIHFLDKDNKAQPCYIVKGGNLSFAQVLCDKEASIDCIDKEYKTPLHYASERGDLYIVCALLNKGASVDCVDKDNKTPLHYASKIGNQPIVHALIDEGASVDCVDKDNKTPLHYASESGHQSVVQTLIDKGASVYKEKMLHCAAEGGLIDLVEMLVSQDIDVNAIDEHNQTPLHYAAKKGHQFVVQLLLNKGASIYKEQLLHCAAEGGITDLSEMLLSQNIDIDALDMHNKTPLHYAARRGHQSIVQLLRDKGANIYKEHLLHCAAEGGVIGLFKMIIAEGIDVNSLDERGRTALHYAAAKGVNYIIMTLLAKGCDPNIKDKDGNTALHLVFQPHYDLTHYMYDRHSYNTIVELLLKGGTDPNSENKRGRTALHYAAERSHIDVDIIRTLLDKGCDPNIKDDDGNTALHLALQPHDDLSYYIWYKRSYDTIVQSLLEGGADLRIENRRGETAKDLIYNWHHFSPKGEKIVSLLDAYSDIAVKKLIFQEAKVMSDVLSKLSSSKPVHISPVHSSLESKHKSMMYTSVQEVTGEYISEEQDTH